MEIDTATRPATTRSAQAPAPQISSDFETFLRMLTTQMQNQDPLNPLESTEFAVQLATFSSVEQQVRTNDLLAGLAEQMSLMGLSQLSGWVGREARSAAPAAYDGAPVILHPDPPAIAETAALVVRNEAGAEVFRGAVPVSTDPIEWSGVNTAGHPVPPGLYGFTLESTAYGEPLATQPLEHYAAVTEARTAGGETLLVLEGGVIVPASEITGLRAP